MDFDELTNEEQIILSIFKMLIGERGLTNEFYFFSEKSGGCGGFCIYKKDGKWISYIYERGEKSGYREYDDLYSLCMDTFGSLDKKSTDYCIEAFPKLVESFFTNKKFEKKEEKDQIDKLRQGVILAARGGGVRSCSTIGVIKALEEAKIPIKGVCGESGSSIVGALLAYGYSAEEIRKIFLQYNNDITKAAKIHGGRGAVVIEELVNKVTNEAQMKDLPLDCWINACKGRLLKPELHLFSKSTTPDDTLGFACSASAGLPVFYGSTHKIIGGKKIKLFDGGLLYNPYIPPNLEYPLVYASFRNSVNYQRFVPLLQRPVDVAISKADVVITTPVGMSIVTGSNQVIEKLVDAGYHEAQKVLCRNKKH
jgi:hypothetical protein